MSKTGKWKIIMAVAIVGIVAALVVLICFLALPQSSQDTQSGVSQSSQLISSVSGTQGEGSVPSGSQDETTGEEEDGMVQQSQGSTGSSAQSASQGAQGAEGGEGSTSSQTTTAALRPKTAAIPLAGRTAARKAALPRGEAPPARWATSPLLRGIPMAANGVH